MLAARVVLGVQRLQALARNMRVDLGGGNIGVPQQHLNHAQIGAMLQQVGGKGVPQGVGESGAVMPATIE